MNKVVVPRRASSSALCFGGLAIPFLSLISCSTGLTPTPDSSMTVCLHGTQQFDLCQYDTQSEKVTALVGEMTLQEKLGQITQSVWHNNVSPAVIQQFGIGSIIHTEGPTPGASPLDWIDKFDEFQTAAQHTRLGIPLLVAVDAVHGQNTFEGAVIFPHNIGMAATRNLELIQRSAQITALEAAGTGFNWTFSPCIAMPKHEHWGRVYEGFSEDRDLTTAAVIASVRGHQGQDLSLPHTIAATAKHYIGDGGTDGGIEGGNTSISEQELRQDYLPPYAAAVEQGIASIMVGFNSVNGVNMHQNGYLVNDVLKNELGFEGVVITDWNGGLRWGDPHLVLNAGIDIVMQPGNHEEFITKLKASVLDGTVPMSRINDAVSRILRMKFDLGLFDNPLGNREYASTIGSTEHRQIARQAVRESMVLLKSEGGVLPLQKDEPLAVVGKHANNSGLQSGGWSIHWQGQSENYAGATTILEGIRAIANDVEYAENGCHGAMRASKAVVVVGESPYAEFKGDSDQLWISDEHKTLIAECRSLGKRVVVVLISGRALVVTDVLQNSDAFIAAWLPGSEGAGVADFLYSVDGFKPTGKSPYAWPARIEDIPLEANAEHALFEFGFGLGQY